nr:DUF4252 domain-containing protein [Bacteroidota bacterium]
MKKAILMIAAIALIAMPFKTFSQSSPTDELFEVYGAKDGFTTIHVTKELFTLFAEITEDAEGDEAREFEDVVKGLDHIRILLYDIGDDNKYASEETLDEFRDMLDDVKLQNFTELMTVKEGKETVKFMIRKNGKTINELLLLLNQDDQAGFISITGNINLKSIARLSKSMNIKGMENLEKLKDHE